MFFSRRYIMKSIVWVSLLFFWLCGGALAEQPVLFEYRDSAKPGVVIKLEGYLYEPQRPNGKTVLMSHGSTGGKREAVAESIKYLGIGRMLSSEGHRVVTYMRKGRGKS